MEISELVEKIKQKRELSGLSNSLIETTINAYLSKKHLALSKLSPPDIKIIIKDMRAELRNYSGRFQLSKDLKSRSILLEKNNIEELLKTHISTSERLEFYPVLKEIIKKINPSSILDLGCGLNPIKLAEKNIKYYASDINQEELELIEKFFKKNDIEGKAFFCNLNDIKSGNLPKANLCIIFKVLDILPDKNHKLAESILSSVDCAHFIVSFSTKTLSGKPMSCPRRFWFEKILRKLNYSFESIYSKNEIFYIIHKF